MYMVRHYKGGIYTVIDKAEHTETGETLVIYMNAEGALFARPSRLFFGMVKHNETLTLRFVPYREDSK